MPLPARHLPLKIAALTAACLALARAPAQEPLDIVWMEFSHDAKHLATLNRQGDLAVYDTKTDTLVKHWQRLAVGEVADWRPKRPEIALVRDIGAGMDVWLVGLDGAMRRLTSHPAADTDPQWRPDGQRLAFLSRRGGQSGIFEIDLDADKPRPLKLAPTPGEQWRLACSPSSYAAAFLAVRNDRIAVFLQEGDAPPHVLADLGPATERPWPQGLSWDATGRCLLTASPLPDGKMVLRTHDAATGRQTERLRRTWIAYAAMQSPAASLLAHTDRGIECMPNPNAAPRLIAPDLDLARPVLADALAGLTIAGQGAAIAAMPEGSPRILPGDARAMPTVADQMARAGRMQEAEKIFASLANTPDAESAAQARLYWARALRHADRAQEALAILSKLVEADASPPRARLDAIAEQGHLLFFELGKPEEARKAYRRALSAQPDLDAATYSPLVMLDAPRPAADAYADLARLLRADAPPGRCAEALAALADTAPRCKAVATAALELVESPSIAPEIGSARPNPLDHPDAARTVARSLATLLHPLDMRTSKTHAPPRDESTLERIRIERLRSLLRARAFEDAQLAALEILDAHGLDSLGGADFLRYYVETDRSGRRVRNLMAKVLLADPVAKSLKSNVARDAEARCLLALAQIKLALLEGETETAARHLADADALFHDLPEAAFTPDIARLQVYLWIFQAKYQERRELWQEAAVSFQTARDLVSKYWPDNHFLVFELDRIGAELAAGSNDPDLLGQILLVERGMGDPILNPTDDPSQLRLGARNLAERLRTRGADSPLRPFVRFHIGRHLARAQATHVGLDYLAPVGRDADLPRALRAAALWELIGIHGIAGHWYAQAQTCRELLDLKPQPAQQAAALIAMSEAQAHLGQWTEAQNAARRAVQATDIPSLRTQARQALQAAIPTP